MLTGSHLQRCIATTTIAMMVGLALWGMIALMRPTPYALVFPEDKTLRATLRLGVTYEEAHQASGAAVLHSGSWECHTVVVGKAESLASATRYRFRCKALDLFRPSASANENPDLRFRQVHETGPDGVTQVRNHYHLSDDLSDTDRAALLAAFHIDTTSFELAADSSFMQQSFGIVVGNDGSIKEVILSEDMRSALLYATAHQQAGPLIRDVLNHTEELPALLKGKKGNAWQSPGHLLMPIAMTRTASQDESGLSITSRSIGGTGRPASLFGKSLSDNSWTSTVVIDEQHHLRSVDITGTLAIGDSLLNAPDRRSYRVVAGLELDYVDEIKPLQ